MASTYHPYRSQPETAFWKKTVSGKAPTEIGGWYTKKFDIGSAKVATAGSCFAQHIGRQLRERGFNYIDAEPAPKLLQREDWLDFGYGMYSARYGNVYTSRQLVQLLERCYGRFRPADDAWEHDGGYVDAFRPTIEPEPFASLDELRKIRSYHFSCVRKMIRAADVFVFTLGLTETWRSKIDDAVYPIVPGASGGDFDPSKYELLNLTYEDVVNDMKRAFTIMRVAHPGMKFILTVSPVSLMATATKHNVITATMYSKSVLRAAAGYLADTLDYVDYFPSYEIISSHVMRGDFYEPDMRSVLPKGVQHVMSQFFSQHNPSDVPAQEQSAAIATAPPPPVKPKKRAKAAPRAADSAKCDEELLAVFGESK